VRAYAGFDLEQRVGDAILEREVTLALRLAFHVARIDGALIGF
jgi:hypothetical protein